MRILKGCIKEGVCSGIWGIDVGTILNIGESGMRDWGRHSCSGCGERLI